MTHLSALRRFTRRLARSERGAVAIEFGIISSVLIVMLVMAVDLGMAMRHRSQMEGAVRAGLQEALNTGMSLDAVQASVLNATDLPSSTTPTATAVRQCFCAGSAAPISCTTGTCMSGVEKQEYVQVTLVQEHQWLLGFPGLPNPLVLTIERSIRVE